MAESTAMFSSTFARRCYFLMSNVSNYRFFSVEVIIKLNKVRRMECKVYNSWFNLEHHLQLLNSTNNG